MAREKTVDLRLPLHEFQMECALGRKRFTTLVCHRRWGKTEFGAALCVDEAMRNERAYPPPQYAFISPQMNQAKRNAWPKFLRQVTKLLPMGARIKEQDSQFILPNGAIIHFIGADRNAEAIRGMYLDGAVVDEIGDIREEVWKDIVRPTLGDYKGWALFIGTPKGATMFKTFRDNGYSKDPRLKDWVTFEYPEEATCGRFPWLDAEERELMALDMGGRGSDKWRREMQCAFDVSPEETFIPMALALVCAKKHPDPESMKGVPSILGIDVGRKDGDPCVLVDRQGSHIRDIMEFGGLDNMEAADVISREILARSPRYVFIDMGSGQGVVDRLHHMGWRNKVVGIQFGVKNGVLPGFLNKRAEMYGSVKKALKEGQLWLPPGDVKLQEELAAPTSWRTSKDEIQLESKEDIRFRLGRSPDRADALALTYAWPNAAQGVTGRRHDKAFSGSSPKEYDPYADIR